MEILCKRTRGAIAPSLDAKDQLRIAMRMSDALGWKINASRRQPLRADLILTDNRMEHRDGPEMAEPPMIA